MINAKDICGASYDGVRTSLSSDVGADTLEALDILSQEIHSDYISNNDSEAKLRNSDSHSPDDDSFDLECSSSLNSAATKLNDQSKTQTPLRKSKQAVSKQYIFNQGTSFTLLQSPSVCSLQERISGATVDERDDIFDISPILHEHEAFSVASLSSLSVPSGSSFDNDESCFPLCHQDTISDEKEDSDSNMFAKSPFRLKNITKFVLDSRLSVSPELVPDVRIASNVSDSDDDLTQKHCRLNVISSPDQTPRDIQHCQKVEVAQASCSRIVSGSCSPSIDFLTDEKIAKRRSSVGKDTYPFSHIVSGSISPGIGYGTDAAVVVERREQDYSPPKAAGMCGVKLLHYDDVRASSVKSLRRTNQTKHVGLKVDQHSTTGWLRKKRKTVSVVVPKISNLTACTTQKNKRGRPPKNKEPAYDYILTIGNEAPTAATAASFWGTEDRTTPDVRRQSLISEFLKPPRTL